VGTLFNITHLGRELGQKALFFMLSPAVFNRVL